MATAHTSRSAVGADGEPGRPEARAVVDLEGLSFAPSSRVLRRSDREIQIERADNAVIVADLPEWVITHLRHRPDSPRSGATGPTGNDPGEVPRRDIRRADVGRTDVHRCDGQPIEVDPNVAPRTDVKPSGAPQRDLQPSGTDRARAPSSGPGKHHAEREPIDPDVGRVLRSLTRAGYLVRRHPGAFAHSATGRLAALEPDLSALDDRFGRHAPAVLDRRHGAHVRVHGTGRMAPLIAALLAAAGVGEVSVPDSGNVTLDDVLPGGLLPTDEGRRTALAAAEAVRRARAGGAGSNPAAAAGDLVISTDGYPVAAHLRAELIADPRPHLVTGVWASHAVIGPLVVPGHTSCLHCADLHRLDRDPAWPVLSTQLVRSGRPSGPSEVAVCSLTAAVTVLQALAFLDGERPATVDGTLEFRLPDWRLRRRHWARHAHCPCAA